VVKQQIKEKEASVKDRIKNLKKELFKATQKEHEKERQAKRQQAHHSQPAEPSQQLKSSGSRGSTADRAKAASVHSKDAYWKSLEYFWLTNPGEDVSAFLAANKRWDAWYKHENSSKRSALRSIMNSDKLINDSPATADKEVLARTQYLVAKYRFLAAREHATVADWHARVKEYSGDIPAQVEAFKWMTEKERENRFSSSILQVVEPSQDKFRAQEQQLERSRHMYLQAMKAFFLERGDVDGGSAGDRAEEEWKEAQRLWEALQQQTYDEQEKQWKDGQEKKLVWEEERLRALEHQAKEHQEVEADVGRANADHEKKGRYQDEMIKSNSDKTAADAKEMQRNVKRQEKEQNDNLKISQETPQPPPKEDKTQHGFGVDDALMGQLAQDKHAHAQTREDFMHDFKADMHRNKLRSTQEVVVRGMWLQSLADFAEASASTASSAGIADTDTDTDSDMASMDAPKAFGALSPLETKWHKRCVCCVCVCICMYTNTPHKHIYMYTYITCIYIYTCIHIHTHTRTLSLSNAHQYAHTHMYVCIYVCICICTYV
jgi:hypothetical protein